MSDFRRDELRGTARFARTARERLRAGMLADAMRFWGYAVQTLAFARGGLAGTSGGLRLFGCTAGLHRFVVELGHAIEQATRRALAPRSVADPGDLIAEFESAISVLETRDGVELPEGAARERARNAVTFLIANYEVRRRDSDSVDTKRAVSNGRLGQKRALE